MFRKLTAHIFLQVASMLMFNPVMKEFKTVVFFKIIILLI